MIKLATKIKEALFVAGVVFSVFTAYVLSANYIFSRDKPERIAVGGDHIFEIEVVSSDEKLEKGLSGRENMCENCGMLFKFKGGGRHAFWMKGMKFDLDIFWISKGKIVYIAKDVSHDSLETIAPYVESDEVLEVNAGAAETAGIGIGDWVK